MPPASMSASIAETRATTAGSRWFSGVAAPGALSTVERSDRRASTAGEDSTSRP